jgi:hypothetical protein
MHWTIKYPRKVGWVGAALVCLPILSSLSISQAIAQDATIIVVPNHATWRVTQSSFIIGNKNLFQAHAPFGSGGTCPLQNTLNSFWPIGSPAAPSTMTLVATYTLPPGATNARALISIDNDVTRVGVIPLPPTGPPGVFASGTPGMITHEGCAIIDENIVRLPITANVADYQLVVDVRDRGLENYFDLRVEVDVP